MTVFDGVDEACSAAPADRLPTPGRRVRFIKFGLLIIVTAIAVIAFVLWVPGALASPTGGCGGG